MRPTLRSVAGLCLAATTALAGAAAAEQRCVDFDALPLGVSYTLPGAVLTTSDDTIQLVTESYCDGGSCGDYGAITISKRQGPGDTRHMAEFNTANMWLITDTPFTTAVVHAMDRGGQENVAVTGTGVVPVDLIGQPTIATPLASIVAEGRTGGAITLTYTATTAFPLNTLLVGGQELAVTRFCLD